MREAGSGRILRRAAAAALVALACGSERNEEPAPSAPAATSGADARAPSALAPGQAAPVQPGSRVAPATGDDGSVSRRARERRRAREAQSPEERRAVWRKRLGVPEDPEARRRLREAAVARDAALVPQLDAEDAAARLEAVREVDLQGPGRERVFALASDDPDPAIRAAAYERLYEEPAATACQIARHGLSDPDASVVRVAIEVLSLFGDESNVAELETLAAEHGDPQVREAAADALEVLR